MILYYTIIYHIMFCYIHNILQHKIHAHVYIHTYTYIRVNIYIYTYIYICIYIYREREREDDMILRHITVYYVTLDYIVLGYKDAVNNAHRNSYRH